MKRIFCSSEMAVGCLARTPAAQNLQGVRVWRSFRWCLQLLRSLCCLNLLLLLRCENLSFRLEPVVQGEAINPAALLAMNSEIWRIAHYLLLIAGALDDGQAWIFWEAGVSGR